MSNSRIAKAIVALSVLLICVLLIYRLFLLVLIRDVVPELQPAAGAVLHSYFLSKITGDSWEDDFATKAKIIRKTAQWKRLGFYRVILANCDMETTQAMLFADYAKPDATALRQDLIDQLRAGHFSDTERQRRVKNWIKELEIVALFG